MPSPGAVWPAMVRNGSRITTGDRRVTSPPTRNTTVRGPSGLDRRPEAAGAGVVEVRARRTTRPPRPPGVEAPKPSAPGKAGSSGRADADIARRPAARKVPDETRHRLELVRQTIDILRCGITDSERRRGLRKAARSAIMATEMQSQARIGRTHGASRQADYWSDQSSRAQRSAKGRHRPDPSGERTNDANDRYPGFRRPGRPPSGSDEVGIRLRVTNPLDAARPMETVEVAAAALGGTYRPRTCRASS